MCMVAAAVLKARYAFVLCGILHLWHLLEACLAGWLPRAVSTMGPLLLMLMPLLVMLARSSTTRSSVRLLACQLA